MKPTTALGEVHAIRLVTEALQPLDPATRSRILCWAYMRYQEPWPVGDIDDRLRTIESLLGLPIGGRPHNDA